MCRDRDAVGVDTVGVADFECRVVGLGCTATNAGHPVGIVCARVLVTGNCPSPFRLDVRVCFDRTSGVRGNFSVRPEPTLQIAMLNGRRANVEANFVDACSRIALV